MAIHIPGRRDRHGKNFGSTRKIVAALSLTAMVDMFTVLVVFLLQNYNVTGEVINIADDVSLPNAQAVKELLPANVVVISKNHVALNEEKIYQYLDVRESKDWMLPILYEKVEGIVQAGETEKSKIGTKIKQAVQGNASTEAEVDEFRRVTVQADKEVDFLTVKKVMYTLTEAGVQEINFAVIKRESSKDSDTL
ncbi:MAG: biopolymer transporter ExbD [Bdellovibrionales bacterium]